MSNDTRHPYSEALPIAQSLARLIQPHCEGKFSTSVL